MAYIFVAWEPKSESLTNVWLLPYYACLNLIVIYLLGNWHVQLFNNTTKISVHSKKKTEIVILHFVLDYLYKNIYVTLVKIYFDIDV